MKVRIGTEGAYPPFNSIDENGNLVGFDVDISNALCDQAGMTCTFVTQDWDGIIPGLQAKKYDAIIASMSITAERMEVVDFTSKYYNTPGRFVAPKGADYEVSAEGLAGKVIGVQRSTTHENFVKATFPDAEVRSYATVPEGHSDLISGRIDLWMDDAVVNAESFLGTSEGADFEHIGPGFSVPEFHGNGAGIAIRKGEDKLRECFNAAIAEIRANGVYAQINADYFDFDVYGAE